MRHILSIVLLLSLLLCAGTAQTLTLWVDPINGSDSFTRQQISDGGGSIAWKTFTKVKTAGTGAQAGDVVNVKPGTYSYTQYGDSGGNGIQWVPGDAVGVHGSPITVQAQPGQTVILDGGNVANGAFYFRTDLGGPTTDFYVIIRGFTTQNYASTHMGVFGRPSCPYVSCSESVASWVGRVMFEGNTLSGGPHHIDSNEARYIIVRNNRMFNAVRHNHYFSASNDHFMAEGNYYESGGYYDFHFNGHSGECCVDGQGLYVGSSVNLIMRRNTFVDASTAGITVGGAHNIHNIYAYNNTAYTQNNVPNTGEGGSGTAMIRFTYSATYTGPIKIKNNIGYGYFNSAAFDTDASATNIASSGQLEMDYNLFTNLETGIMYRWNNVTYTSLATFQGATPFEDNAKSGQNPLFTNIGSKDFTLQATSPAIDAGTKALTTTTISGTGTVVTVNDAGYFTDGFGLRNGDLIKIGSNNPVTITSVDYSTNQITVSPGITWNANDPVGLPYNGSAPDMGAFESGTAGTGDVASLGIFYADITNGDDSRTCDQAKVITTPRQHGTALASCMAAGSTLYYRAGTYADFWDSSFTVLQGGSSFATATTISAFSNEIVTLAPVLTAGQRAMNLNATENTYIIVSKLIISASNTGQHAIAVTNNAHHIRLSEVTAQNCLESCVRIETAGNEYLNGTVSNCGYNGRGCIQLGTGANNNLIQGNVITNFASGGITDRSDNYPTVANSSNIIRANRITNESPGNAEWGIAVGRGSNSLVVNNLVYSITGGVRIVPDASGIKVYNNTLNGNGSGILLDVSAFGTLIRNNILSSNSTNYQEEGSGAVLQNNLCLTAGIACAIIGDPRFTNIAAGNFKQLSNAPTSVAIDTGVCLSESTPDFAGVNRPLGSTCDVGAYEVAADSGPLPPDVPTAQLQRGPYSGSMMLMNNR